MALPTPDLQQGPTQALTQALAGLRDVHSPPPVSWWPPAPGWWLLAALLLLALFGLIRGSIKRYRAGAWRREALLALNSLEADAQSAQCSDEAFAQALLSWLKAVLVERGDEELVALSGATWLKRLGGRFAEQGEGLWQTAMAGASSKDGVSSLPRSAWLKAARDWLRGLS